MGDTGEKSPMSDAMWVILRVGMIFGIIPLRFNSKIGKLDLEWSFGRWFPILYSVYTFSANLLIFIFAVVIFFRDFENNEVNLVEQFLDMVYHSQIIGTIVICLAQCPRIPTVLEEWNEVEALYRSYEDEERRVAFGNAVPGSLNSYGEFIRVLPDPHATAPHKRFALKAQIVSALYATASLFGAGAYFTGVNLKGNFTTTQDYLDEVATVYIIDEVTFSWTGIYVLFIGHTMEIAWAYGDMFILSMCYGLCYQFGRFNKIANRISNKVPLHPADIERLRIFYSEISKATKKTTGSVCTLTCMVFVGNILYLFSRVYNGLEEDLSHPNRLVNLEALYAFTYLILRIFATATMATAFYSASFSSFKPFASSHRLHQTSELHQLLMDRLCTQFLTSNVAISGSGYFYLNQNFIATLVSALVTYEVVILQFSVSARTTDTIINSISSTNATG